MMQLTTSSDTAPVARHLFAVTIARIWGIAALGLLILTVLIPISTAGLPDSSIFNLVYTHDQLKFRLFAGGFSTALNVFMPLYGLTIGMAVCSFMLDRRQASVYFSLGLTRTELLLIRLGAGVSLLFVSILVPMLASLALNIAALGYAPYFMPFFLHTLFGLFAMGVVPLLVAAVASSLAGTLSESIAFAACLLSLPSAVLYGANALMKYLLWGNPYGMTLRAGTGEAAASLLELTAPCNPLLFFTNDLKTYSIQYVNMAGAKHPPINVWLLPGWFLVAAAIAVCAIAALKQRKSECAGISGANTVMNRVVGFAAAFATFCAVFDALAGIIMPIALVGAACVFLSAYTAIIFALKRDLGRMVREWPRLGAGLAAVFAAVIILRTGGFGYSGRVPSVDAVRRAEISYVGTPCYLGSLAKGSAGGGAYYVASSVNLTSRQDIAVALALQSTLAHSGHSKLGLNATNFDKSTVPYDITVTYTLKNGRKQTRYYDRATMQTLGKMLTLDETSAVKSLAADTITGKNTSGYWAAGAYRSGSIYLCDNWYLNPVRLDLSATQRSELLTAIAKDVDAQTMSDRYFPQKPSRGVLMFSQAGDSDTSTFAYNMENTLVYLSDSFGSTLSFLRQYGLDTSLAATPPVESISIIRYEPFGLINHAQPPRSPYFMGYKTDNPSSFIIQKDFGRNYSVDDPKQMGELLPLLQNNYFMSGGGYLAAVKLNGSDTCVYKFLPEAVAPDYVKDSA